MRFVVLTAEDLAQAQALDDDDNYAIGGRRVEMGPLAGQFVAPVRMMDDPACPAGLADYLGTLHGGEYQAAELFAPDDE